VRLELPGLRAHAGPDLRHGGQDQRSLWNERLPWPARRVHRPHPRAGARELYNAAVRLRGGFLKFGQFVSARRTCCPTPTSANFSKLQDRVRPRPRGRPEGDRGRPVPSPNTSSSSTPLASAASLRKCITPRSTTALGRGQGAVPEGRGDVPREAKTRRILVSSSLRARIDLPTISRSSSARFSELTTRMKPRTSSGSAPTSPTATVEVPRFPLLAVRVGCS